MAPKSSLNALKLGLLFFALGGCVVLGGCSSGVDTPAGAPTTVSRAEVATACPLGIFGARVEAVDTAEGVALLFTGPADRVDELRIRTRHAARMHGPEARRGMGHDGRHAHGGRHGLQAMQLPPSRVQVSDVDGGSRLDFTPFDPNDRNYLVRRAHDSAERMNTAACHS